MFSKKLAISLISAIFIINIHGITTFADWKQISDTEYEYYISENTKCKNGLYKIDDIMYRFDKNGICLGEYTGWTKQKNDSSKLRYYSNGWIIFGWKKINGKFYYFDSNNRGFFTGEVHDEIMILSDPIVSYEKENIIVTFTFENPTNEIVTYGNLFRLERFINNEWISLDLKEGYTWLNESIGASPNSKGVLVINATNQYGELENGTYRIAYYDLDEAIAYSDKFELE